MTKLSVNVNKLATLRNSRGKNTPNVAEMAARIIGLGAHGITVHPRPDGRHIRRDDVFDLKKIVKAPIEYNIEGYPSPDFLELLESAAPDQATLVPDPPEALTSNAGWDLSTNEAALTGIAARLRDRKIRVSLFVDPARFDAQELSALKRIRPDRIELYTEAFHDAFNTPNRAQMTALYSRVAKLAKENGVAVNAGHDLNQENLSYLLEHVPEIEEVSIGHALICEALLEGLPATIRNYLTIVKRE